MLPMNEKHAQNVPNVKPGVLLCNPRFDEFNADDVFVKDSKNPETYGVGKWWGGDGAFWDFTKPEGRTAWKKYLTESIIAVGTDSVWNDNCEYDSLMDKDCTCDFDGKGGTIGQLKPLMSTLMCKVGADAVVEHNAKARPYMVCRSGSAGIQRYAQTWCCDAFFSFCILLERIAVSCRFTTFIASLGSTGAMFTVTTIGSEVSQRSFSISSTSEDGRCFR